MLNFLKNHPFAVEAFFESSLVLTFAVEKETIQGLIPECLEPDSFKDKWAFVAVAMVQTRNLRPKGFPEILGNDFFLAGYRVFVKYTTSQGKRLRGLYILKSQTDKKKMEFMGNIFTHYNYSTTDINYRTGNNITEITSHQSGLKIIADTTGGTTIPLPTDSPFSDWKEARRFAGPLPFTFTFNREKSQVLIIEGVRENWNPEPVKIKEYQIDLLKKLIPGKPVLANAFIIRKIPYYWKKGKTDKWKP
jgi:uncharacterized protein YqjF (DUF2071 family)